MNDAKIPSRKKDWQAIDIFLFSNGQQYSPPRKYHLRSEELNWWDATLGYLARSQYGSKHSLLNLYTLKGQKVNGPLELSNGASYVAVLPEDKFVDAGYENYVVKASRSWEKRQSKINSILGEPISEVIHEEEKTENEINADTPEQMYMLDAKDTTKAQEENNVSGKPIVNAKSEENITGTRPNTLRNLGPIQSVEKKRPNSHPIKRPTIPRRPTTPSPTSKLPLKRGKSPIKTPPVKSSDQNNMNTTPTPRPKTPSKPEWKYATSHKITSPAPNLIPIAKTTTSSPKHEGQTADLPRESIVNDKDVIIIADLNKNNESYILSTLVEADKISARNAKQDTGHSSLDTVYKGTDTYKTDLSTINELVNDPSGKIIYSPANTTLKNLDSIDSASQYTSIQYGNNPVSDNWNNMGTKQVPTNEDISTNKFIPATEQIYGDPRENNENKNKFEATINNNTPINNDTFMKQAYFQNYYEPAEKTTQEPVMVLVNRGDIISLKLNLELKNTEGALKTSLNSNMAQSDAKGSHVNSNLPDSGHVGGKSEHSNAADDRPHICCPGNTVVVRCSCCNCYQYQTDIPVNNTKPVNNDLKTYFVVLPVLYGNERFNNSNEIPKFEKGNQNAESLTRLNKNTSRRDKIILTPTKSEENRPLVEHIKILEIPDESEGSRKHSSSNDKNRDSILVKHNISQTLNHIHEQHLPSLMNGKMKQLEERSTQSEWHNVLMEIRRTEDGHYTFHLPPLSTLRRYKVPPFQ